MTGSLTSLPKPLESAGVIHQEMLSDIDLRADLESVQEMRKAHKVYGTPYHLFIANVQSHTPIFGLLVQQFYQIPDIVR